ncbi:receptor-like protein kinase, partial [Trifolium pratense]
MRDHQKDLRAAMYKGLTEAIVSGDCVANVTGKRIVLPASFVGGARYMIQNYQDAMTICSWAGYPDYADTSTGITAASMYRQNTGAGIGKKRARKAVAKGGSSNISQINHIPDFMHSYVESITDVKSDGNCGYRVIALGHTNNEDDYDFIKKSMLDELQLHKQDYLKIYGGGERLSYIRNALLPAKRKARRHGVALIDKWLTFPDMGHIVASILGKVVVKLTKHGASETFFPLCGVPSSNPSSLIICLGAIPGHY